jgi:hypothetical protein
VSGSQNVDKAAFAAAATALVAHDTDGLLFDDDLYADAILRELAALDADYRRQVVVASLSNRHHRFLPDDVASLEVDGYDMGVACVSVVEAAMCPPRMNCPSVLLPATLIPPTKPRTARRPG